MLQSFHRVQSFHEIPDGFKPSSNSYPPGFDILFLNKFRYCVIQRHYETAATTDKTIGGIVKRCEIIPLS